MEIRSAEEAGVLIISVKGRLDAASAGDLESEVRRQVDAGSRRLVLDLTDLAYVSSAGIRVFLLAARKLRGQGTLLLAAPSPMVRQVFDIAGVDAFVDICETTAAAVDRLRT
jgi:stage II sporulation protein AA (anti-sigma F factor antagonist)